MHDVPYVFFVSGKNDAMLVIYIALYKTTWLPLPVSICLFLRKFGRIRDRNFFAISVRRHFTTLENWRRGREWGATEGIDTAEEQKQQQKNSVACFVRRWEERGAKNGGNPKKVLPPSSSAFCFIGPSIRPLSRLPPLFP